MSRSATISSVYALGVHHAIHKDAAQAQLAMIASLLGGHRAQETLIQSACDSPLAGKIATPAQLVIVVEAGGSAMALNFDTVSALHHVAKRDDFIEIVGQRLLDLQETLFDMLVEITDFFDANGITYTLGGGTCLGAVRHQGFIPWDDDIDLNVPRSSYEILLERFDECLGERYWLHAPERTPGYPRTCAQIRKKGTVLRLHEDEGLEECGVFVDIFVVENAPDNGVVRTLHGVGSLAFGFALSCKRFANHKAKYLAMAEDNPDAAAVFKAKIVIGEALSFRPIDTWRNAWNRWNSLCKNEQSRYVVIPVGRKHYFGELYRRSDYFPVTMAMFEGRQVCVPANPDAYLTALYGEDYMTPPSENERECHVVYEFDLGDEK